MSRHVDSGRCGVCGHVGDFLEEPDKALRENHRCTGCRATLRYRMQADALVAAYGFPDCSLADLVGAGGLTGKVIYEPGIIGPFRRLLRDLPGYVNSAYWPDVEPGDERDGVRCEDLHHLTFADGSFDLVITSDIFEHVRRPSDAFGEVFRVLRPGGRHVFTVPLGWPLGPRSRPRVDTSTAEDVFLKPARYHGSPTDSAGALVYTDFGMDLPDELQEIGFETVTYHGYRNAVTFASRKPILDRPRPHGPAASVQTTPTRLWRRSSRLRRGRRVHD